MKSENKFDEFRLARKLDFLTRSLHSVLLITLIIGINLFAIKFSFRWDITQNMSNTLSPESEAHIDKTEDLIEVVVLMNEGLKIPGGRLAREDIIPLLEEYEHACNRLGKDNLSFRFVDIYRDRDEMLLLKQQYNYQQENVILVGSGSKRTIIDINDLYSQVEQNETWVFNGEQVLTGAILEVSNADQKRVYFTVGQGEMSLSDADPERGLSELEVFCESRSIELNSIDLSKYDYIPDEVDLLVIASPQAEFSDVDVEKLRHYLEKTNGSLIVFIEPFRQHNLDDLLYDWGILCEDAVIIDPGQDFQTSSGNLILRHFAEHPITLPFIEKKMFVFSNQPRPVRMDPGPPRIAGVSRTALVATSQTSWMEKNFKEEQLPSFTSGRDVNGPIPVGVLAERGGAEALGLTLKGGKLIVFGDASIISNRLFRIYGNRVLVSNSMNWCLQRDYLLSIPPEKIESYQLTLSEADMNTLFLALMALPLVFVVFGVFVRIIRR